MPEFEWIKRLRTLVGKSDAQLLIWRSSTAAGLYATELRLLKDRLEKDFPRMRIKEIGSSGEPRVWDEEQQEIMALLSSDLCIVLSEPGGVPDQITHLTGSGHAQKLYVLSPEEDLNRGISPLVFQQYGNQEFFAARERGGTLVDRMFQRIEQMAIRKVCGEESNGDGSAALRKRMQTHEHLE